MSKPLKRRGKFETNIDMPCSGEKCRTPEKPFPHKHRKRLSFPTREAHDLVVAQMKLTRHQFRHGVGKGEINWETFKLRFLPYSRNKDSQTHYRDTLAIRYLEKYYPIAQLKQITPELLISLINRLTSDGKRAWNVNRIITALKAMMRFAEDIKLIDAQNWRLVKRIPTPKGRLKFWTIEETTALYARTKGTWETIARLSIEAGLRLEEIHSLKKSEIDFERKRIHIVGDDTWHPKDYERRWVPMKESTYKYLKSMKMGEVYVLEPQPTIGSMTTYFRRIVKEAGLTGSLHTGRHTYGSRLAMEGVPIPVIQQRMGHADIKTTMIYAHLCPDKMQEVYAA